MPYSDHYVLADGMIAHLDTVMANVTDSFIQSRYVGFVSVTAVTVYELAIKEIFCEFGEKTHSVLGCFTRSFFERINGRIKISTIKDDYLKRFGDNYVVDFKTRLETVENHWLLAERISISSSYNNVVEWRNGFSHGGKVPIYVTYEEVIKSYKLGKEVIKTLADVMGV